MKIYPILDRIVVKKLDAPPRKSGQLFLPEQQTQDKPFLATVVAVPQEKYKSKDTAIFIKTGDKVLFTKYAGVEWKINQETYIILRQSDILAVICEEEA